MGNEIPRLIRAQSVTEGWARVFDVTMKPGNTIGPIVLSFPGFTGDDPPEDMPLRAALDSCLAEQDKNSTAVSAMLIFPYHVWVRKGKPDYQSFTRFCVKRLLPRLVARDSRNRNGTYFSRMMAYTGANKASPKEVNQLEFIIDIWRRDRGNGRTPRESAMQIAIFDPAKDHTGQPVRGFPCLQQIGLSFRDDGLTLNAVYPSQYIFDRGYGNYLGLLHLGRFLAHSMDLQLVGVNCVIWHPLRGDVNKTPLRDLHAQAMKYL